MHIPDGFLNPTVWGTMDAVALPAVVFLAKRAQKTFNHHKIPLMGVMGAFVFAAQMINFPVGNGTSGHLVGGALLSFTLGPAAAAIVMTAILATQALVFQDGGILALGANVFNMAIAGVLAGYLPYLLFRGNKIGVFTGGMLSVLTSAVLALVEILLSGVPMPSGILLVSLALFVVSGVIEGAITLVVVQSLERINRGFLRPTSALPVRGAMVLAGSAVFLAVIGILFASTHPDGLQMFARQIGISGRANSLFITPFSDYKFNLIGNEWLNRAMAGIAGLLIVYVLCIIAARVIAAARPALREQALSDEA